MDKVTKDLTAAGGQGFADMVYYTSVRCTTLFFVCGGAGVADMVYYASMRCAVDCF